MGIVLLMIILLWKCDGIVKGKVLDMNFEFEFNWFKAEGTPHQSAKLTASPQGEAFYNLIGMLF